MLFPVGARKLGKCDVNLAKCTASGVNIVSKVVSGADGNSLWVCRNCLVTYQKDIEDNIKDQNLDYLGVNINEYPDQKLA